MKYVIIENCKQIGYPQPDPPWNKHIKVIGNGNIIVATINAHLNPQS